MTTAVKTRTKTKPQIPKRWRDIICDIPGYDPFADCEGCWFDEDKAEKYTGFIEECCTHIEGVLASQSFLMERWEKAIIANLFGWYKRDFLGRVVRRYRKCFIYVPRKNGKQISLDTPLPTPKGWTTIGDLRVGDELFDQNGLPCRVVCLKPIEEKPESYKVHFSNGETIKACADHLWVTTARVDSPRDKSSGRKKRPLTEVRTTKRILDTLCYGKRNDRNHSVSMPEPLQLDEVKLPVSPYVLGVWLGDGDSDCARFTIGEKDYSEMIRNFEIAGYSLDSIQKDRRNNTSRIRINPSRKSLYGGVVTETKNTLNAKLRYLGLFHNKHIPQAYLRSSISQRCSLLQGIVDSDGFVEKRGNTVEITTINSVFANGICELLASLGIKHRSHKSDAKLNGRIIGPKWRILFKPPKDMVIARLERKQSRLKYPKINSRSRTVQITDIESCESVPMRCIAVDSPTNTFLCGKTMIPTHNTPLAAAIHNAIFFMDNEAGQVNNIAAASRDQASKLYRHISGMIYNEPLMSNRCSLYTATRSITKSDNSVTKVIPADDKVAHGDNQHFGAIDELHTQPNRKLYDTLTTAMASANRIQPLLLFMTTADYDRPSVCNEEYDYAIKVRDGIIDDAAYLPVIYEAMHLNKDGRLVEDDWTNEDVWYKANPNLGISVSLDYLRGECKKAQENPAYENTFKRLHLNIRTEQSERVISMADWDGCCEKIDWAEFSGKPCWAALDIGAIKDFVSLIILFGADVGEPVAVEYEDANGEQHTWNFVRRDYWLRHFCWLPDSPIRRDPRMESQIAAWSRKGHIIRTPGNVVDYDQVGADIARFIQPYGLQQFAIDQGFQGMQITQDMQKMLGEDRVVAFRQGIFSMAAPFREMMQLMIQGRLHHDGDPVLRWMASNVAAESRGGLTKPSKDKSSEKIDGITALTMAIGIAMTSEGPKKSRLEDNDLRFV